MMIAKEPELLGLPGVHGSLGPKDTRRNSVPENDGLVHARLFGDVEARPCALAGDPDPRPCLRASYELWSVQVKERRGYRFTMPVPSGWIWIPPSAPDVLGAFVPAEMTGPQLTVRIQRIRWEVDVLAWLMHRCHAWGLVVTMARPQGDHEGSRFELGGTRDFDSAVWRISAALHTGRLLMVEAVAPLVLWNQMQELFRPCRREFEILPSPQWSTIEPYRTFKTEQIQFSVPASWSAKEHTIARDHERYLLSAAQSRCRGLVRIDTGCSATPLHLRQSRILRYFEDLGWRPLGQCSIHPSGIRTFCGAFEGSLRNREEIYHLRVAHRRLGKAYVDYTTLVPIHDDLAEDAMRTVRAGEIAIESTLTHTSQDGDTVIIRRRHEGSAR